MNYQVGTTPRGAEKLRTGAAKFLFARAGRTTQPHRAGIRRIAPALKIPAPAADTTMCHAL
jgi:hypothetical protein